MIKVIQSTKYSAYEHARTTTHSQSCFLLIFQFNERQVRERCAKILQTALLGAEHSDWGQLA